MLRTIWVLFVVVVVTLPLATATLLIAAVRSTSPWIDRITRTWGRLLVAAAGIELRTENMDVLQPGQRYVLIANHSSYFDVPCLFAAVPQPVRFMAKASLFRVPFFGWAIGRAGFIPVDRKNRRTAVKSFELAADRIRKGNTIVVFPEEGRSRERTMKPFQRGAFLLAIKSEQPIVPLAVQGTYDVYNARSRWVRSGPVTVKAGTPIATTGLGLRDKDRLLTESRAQIERMLSGNTGGSAGGDAGVPQ